eukprot:SAG11_NODE_15350_length_581_cov_1.031120_1_plen_33_part_01
MAVLQSGCDTWRDRLGEKGEKWGVEDWVEVTKR